MTLARLFPSGLLQALLLSVLCIFATACSTQSIAPASGPVPTIADYTLEPGDQIGITTFNEAGLSKQLTLEPDGTIDMPLIGRMPASGRTVQQLALEIEAALAKGYIRDPKVSIELTTKRPYYILGEVRNPGEYPTTPGMTVLNAIAKAGGFTAIANRKKVFIRRKGANSEEETKLTVSTPVLPGDTVRIGERYF
ncbi:MAG: polysaccharide biosynthesis/export family protein [Sphingobium sp.]